MKKALKIVLALAVFVVAAFAFGGMKAKADGAPVIVEDPHNRMWRGQNSFAIYRCVTEEDNMETESYQWYLNYNGTQYDLCGDIAWAPWYQYTAGPTGGNVCAIGNTYLIEGIQEGLNGAEIWCEVSNSYGKTESRKARISVSNYVPTIQSFTTRTRLDAKTGEPITLRAEVGIEASDAQDYNWFEYQWYTSPTDELMDMRAIDGANDTVYTFTPTEPGVHFLFFGAFYTLPDPVYGDGPRPVNYSYSSVITVVAYGNPAEESTEGETETAEASAEETKPEVTKPSETTPEVTSPGIDGGTVDAAIGKA